MKTLFTNAKIFPDHHNTDGLPSATCLAVEDSIIVHVGNQSDAEFTRFLGDGSATHVNLDGGIVAPGFVDAHVHLLQFGISLTKTDIRACRTLDEVYRAVCVAATKDAKSPRLLFRGWLHGVTGNNVLASALDEIDSRPIYIDSDDLHAAWCNTAALKEMGLWNEPDPEGGKIHRDETGAPSGLLEEAAVIGIVWSFLGNAMSRDEKLGCLRSAVREQSIMGYTSVVDMAMDGECWGLLQYLHSEGELPLRVAAHFLILPCKTDEENRAQVERVAELYKSFNLATSPDLRVAGIKIVCDGVIDGCTAAISKPYLNTGRLIQPVWNAEPLQVVLDAADEAGMQCALHAIGDAAVTLAVNGLEALKTRGRRHRIEHLEITRPEDAKRLGELGITASIQPVHCDPDQGNHWPALIGHEQCSRAFAYAEFDAHGAPIAIGTDAPTAPHVPWNNIFNATTRKSFRDPECGDTLNEHFKLRLRDTLKAMSYGGAYSCFAEGMLGSLEVGKKADFIIIHKAGDWDSDPASLLSSRAVSTWLGGKCVAGNPFLARTEL
ncbi:hypothetical protein EsH8_XII_000053 [Colletotrichum jinshuiense]